MDTWNSRQPTKGLVQPCCTPGSHAADAILYASPEYNYSIPGVLKNAIDWASRPYGDSAWEGKPAAIMGASIGMLSGARAQYHMHQAFVYLDMYPLNRPEVMVPVRAGQV